MIPLTGVGGGGLYLYPRVFSIKKTTQISTSVKQKHLNCGMTLNLSKIKTLRRNGIAFSITKKRGLSLSAKSKLIVDRHDYFYIHGGRYITFFGEYPTNLNGRQIYPIEQLSEVFASVFGLGTFGLDCKGDKEKTPVYFHVDYVHSKHSIRVLVANGSMIIGEVAKKQMGVPLSISFILDTFGQPMIISLPDFSGAFKGIGGFDMIDILNTDTSVSEVYLTKCK